MYYISLNNQSIGPMTAEQLICYPVNQSTPVSKDGSPWMPLINYPELMQLLNSRAQFSGNRPAESKKVICGIMAILFGYLGIQYFICGKTTGGIITILLSLVTCGGWSVITFIQGIIMLTMTDEQFNQKYVYSNSAFPLF